MHVMLVDIVSNMFSGKTQMIADPSQCFMNMSARCTARNT